MAIFGNSLITLNTDTILSRDSQTKKSVIRFLVLYFVLSRGLALEVATIIFNESVLVEKFSSSTREINFLMDNENKGKDGGEDEGHNFNLAKSKSEAKKQVERSPANTNAESDQQSGFFASLGSNVSKIFNKPKPDEK